MSEPWNTPDANLISECCSAPPTDEVIECEGRCSKCKEMSSFIESIEEIKEI